MNRIDNGAPQHDTRTHRVTLEWVETVINHPGDAAHPEPFPETVLEAVYTVVPKTDAADYAEAIQEHIDSTAKAMGYESGFALASYVQSTIPTWAAEAAAFVSWRDAVWTYAYTELGKVQNEEREQPTITELVEELPAITWPT